MLQTFFAGFIRLVNGLDSSQGRLEIFYDGNWRPVVRDDWDWKATRTACKELGYKYGIIPFFNGIK